MAALVVGVPLIGLGAIAWLDARTLRAPNRFVYPLILVAVGLAFTLGRTHAFEALLGGAVAFGVLLVVAIAGRGAMGFGDVKYGLICGIAVGLRGVLPMLLAAFVVSGMVAAVVLVLRLRRRQDAIAFTPFLFAGVLFSLLWLHASATS